MLISFEGKIGISLALLALAGGGAVMVAPEQLWVGWSMIGVAAAGAIALAAHHFELALRNTSVLVLIGTGLIISGGIIGLVGAMRTDGAKLGAATHPNRPLLTDEPSLLTLFMNLLQPTPGSVVNGFTEDSATGGRVYYNIYADFRSNSKYLAFYVPHSASALSVIRELANDYKTTISSVDGAINFNTKAIGNTSSVDTRNYTFSGAIYIFHEDALTVKDLSNLSDAFREANATAQFYSTDFKFIQRDQIKLGHTSKMAVYEMQNGIIRAVQTAADH